MQCDVQYTSYGAWRAVNGVWMTMCEVLYVVHCVWCTVYVVWPAVCGIWCIVQGVWRMVHDREWITKGKEHVVRGT